MRRSEYVPVAVLPIDPEDDALVDRLVARRIRDETTRPLCCHAVIGGPHRWGCTCWQCAERDRRGQEANDRAVKFIQECMALDAASPPEHDNYEVSPW